MKQRGRGIVTTLLLALLALSGWKAARAAVAIAQAPRAGERAGVATVRGTPVRAEATGPLAEIALSERAVVFIYTPDCSVCHANMANWIDLVGALRDGATALYAVSPVDSPAARTYWDGLERRVRVVIATPEEVHRAFGVGATPATLMVRKGTVRGEIIGSLTAAARAQVRRFAAEGTL